MFPAADDPINMEVSTAKAVKAEANARTVETKRLLCAYEYDYVAFSRCSSPTEVHQEKQLRGCSAVVFYAAYKFGIKSSR